MRLLKKALFPIAQRFVAGETEESAVERAQELNEDGIRAMTNLLGEHIRSKEMCDDTVEEYDDLLGTFEAKGLDACLSVKPTQLGLEISFQRCLDNLKYLVRRAKYVDRFVWIDMESSRHTEETIELYKRLREDFDNVGLCIQAALKRSEEDIDKLLEHDAIIRLVKGVYNEPKSKAFAEKDDVDANYRKLAEKLFAEAKYFAIGTHDLELVEYARQLRKEQERDKNSFEFQFLMGIRDDTKRELADEGYKVAEYVPYGEEWVSYHWRRVMERKENLWFALKAIFSG
jgi:proline dehydrogenase